MRLDAVRRLWEKLRVSGSRGLEEDDAAFTSSELAVGRMVLPVLEDLEVVRKAVDELSARTLALRVALDLLPVAAIVLDQTGRLLTSNGAAQRLFGGAAIPGAVVESAARAVATGTEKSATSVLRADGSMLRVVPAQLANRPSSGDPAVIFLIPQNAPPQIATEILTERYGLSPMQARVVALVAQGLTNKEIAARLGISPETVHKHLNAVFQRTGVNTRAAVVAVAFGAPYGLTPQGS